MKKRRARYVGFDHASPFLSCRPWCEAFLDFADYLDTQTPFFPVSQTRVRWNGQIPVAILRASPARGFTIDEVEEILTGGERP